jgi:hypothetical protein
MVTASRAFCVGRHVACLSLALTIDWLTRRRAMEDQARVHRTTAGRGDTVMLAAMLALAVVWTFSIFYALVVVAT